MSLRCGKGDFGEGGTRTKRVKSQQNSVLISLSSYQTQALMAVYGSHIL
jgi:hypothetical protein